MHITIIAPPYEPCPPLAYGGAERVISWWMKEMIRQGHHVDLFARQGSTVGTRIFGWPHYGKEFEFALWVYGQLDPETDVVMDNTHEKWLADICKFPYIGALHMTSCRTHRNLVGCSKKNAEMNGTPYYNYLGIDLSEYHFESEKEDYVLFLGALAPHKQIHLAIEAARAAHVPIKVIGALRPGYESYGYKIISSLKEDEYLGELGGFRKHRALEKAAALILPVDCKTWVEPGATVIFEALASGTPIITSPSGACPEIIEDGINGYIVEPIVEKLAKAIKRIVKARKINSHDCRQTVEEKYSMPITVEGWLKHFERAISGEEW